ncbi:hypothetical protein ACFL0U_03875 [Pseudomonadota bacterium]
MPNKDNKKEYFSQEKQQETIKWLNEKWKVKECEVCKQKEWIVQDFLCFSPRYEGGGLTIGGKVAPHVTLVCKNCGNTKFFNAAIMGLLDSKEEGKDVK